MAAAADEPQLAVLARVHSSRAQSTELTAFSPLGVRDGLGKTERSDVSLPSDESE